MRRAKHPRSSEIVERELQLVDLERELASIGEVDAGTDADSTDAGAPVRRAGIEHAEHAQVAS